MENFDLRNLKKSSSSYIRKYVNHIVKPQSNGETALEFFMQKMDGAGVYLLDEPENSLDISWQYELINTLVKLNPNAQYFITTHSPSIFGDGWGDKIIYMEDVTTPIK